MKILYLHHTSLSSEKANVIQVLQMCSAFSENGHEVVLCTPENNGCPQEFNDIIQEKTGRAPRFSHRPYSKFTVGNRLEMLGGVLGVRKILRNIPTNICFVRNPYFLNETIKMQIPSIFESHNINLHENRMLNRYLVKGIVENTQKAPLKKFVTISNALAKEWGSNGVPGRKILALHDGVDANNYITNYDMEKLRVELGIPIQSKVVLYAGSLYFDRGIEKIFKLSRSFKNIQFYVLGGPEAQKEKYSYIARDSNSKNIHFLGYVPHYKVKEFLFAADILLMVWTDDVKTINYCSPLKMFEYMAAGKVIVGDGFPTIREVLNDGEHAFLADPNSYDSLENKLKLALSQNSPEVMGGKVRELAIDKYSWKMRAEKILNEVSF